MGFQGKVIGRRKAPYPNSILDRKALTEALEADGISVKRLHIDAFYKALHKQKYPPLSVFVENYYANERKEISQQQPQLVKEEKNGNDREESDTVVHHEQPPPQEEHNNNNNNQKKNHKTRNKMTLPKNLLKYIAKTPDFVHTTSRVKERLTSKDRSTTKLIIELYDGFVIESVLMRYKQKGSGRASLCVSSQCGCAMGCTFCATGTMGLSGNLTTGEILEQLVWADRVLLEESLSFQQSKNNNNNNDNDDDHRDDDNSSSIHKKNKRKELNIESVRNVVFMGMGEPLDNYNNVTEACRTMIDTSRWNLAHGRVTVSTVGLISQIRRLTKELPEVSLALSLHAPNQDARTAIVPTASRYPIEGLIDALDNHMMAYLNQRRKRRNSSNNNNSITATAVEGTAEQQLQVYTVEERIKESSRRRAMIEYIMLTGETSSFECAHQLGKLCENRHLVVNLIPYNATDVKDKLQCPSDEHMLEFRDIVQSYGTFCTIRRTMGADIASACGQLIQKKEQEEKEEEEKKQQDATVDIEDVVMKRDNISTNNETTLLVKGSPDTSNTAITKSPSIPVGIPSGQKKNVSSTWTESLSSDDLDRWSRILTVTATISATCFVTSSIFFLQRKRP